MALSQSFSVCADVHLSSGSDFQFYFLLYLAKKIIGNNCSLFQNNLRELVPVPELKQWKVLCTTVTRD